MKFTTKKLLLISGLVIFVLVGNRDFYLKNGSLQQSNLKTRLQKMEMQYETELTRDFTKNNIQNLKINVDNENVKIHAGNSFKVYICYLINTDQKPLIHLKDNTLNVKAFTEKADYLAFRPKMEVTIPAKKKLNKLTITKQNGKIDMQNLQIETTKLKLHTGNFTCKKFISKKLKIIAKNENINFNKVNLNRLNLENQKGDIDLYKLTTTKLSHIKNDNGDITLKKFNTPGLDVSTAMGKVQIQGRRQKESRYKTGNKKLTLKIQTNAGDIELE
ncbi:MAG: DUF4097 domain-containing protein [Lactobacillales bacterium]|jgi:hypothetical protein|nr:DUF4097 domain-containing protein [Lactobacillales bacterium]